MVDFDVAAFVAKLERMGVKLTAVPLADGKTRVNRWHMLQAADHTQQIQDWWASQIGDRQERVDALAAFLAARTIVPHVTGNRFAGLKKAQ